MIIFYVFSYSRVTANTLLQNMCILNQKHFNMNKYLVLLREAHLFRRCLCDLLPVLEFISSQLLTLVVTGYNLQHALGRTPPVQNKKLRKYFDSKLNNSTTNLINLWSKCFFLCFKIRSKHLHKMKWISYGNWIKDTHIKRDFFENVIS